MKDDIIAISEQECKWTSTKEYGEMRWKLLVDSTKINSSGISVRILKLEPTCELPLHHHSPKEVYIVKKGRGLLLKSDKNKKLKKGDLVFIPENSIHGIRNTSSRPMLIYWIFPTNSWEEIKYNFIE